MSFAFFKWVHDELVALRAAVARLESHTGSPESKPADKPADFGPIDPSGAPAPAPQPAQPPAAGVPVPQPPGGNTTDPTAPGFIMPAHVDPAPAPAAAAVDTSADTLDYNAVRDVGIDLTGPKTIVNCPASVVVKINQASGQSGAHNSYTVTVNGQSSFQANVQGEWMSNNVGMAIAGPTVTVSVDSPGLQMEIE